MMGLVTANRMAPAAPDCFSSREAWVGYLITANEDRKCAPFHSNNEFRVRFNYCTDCTQAHAAAMSKAGRCNPSKYRAIAILEMQS